MAGDKRQGQQIKDEEEGEGNKGKEERVFVPEEDKGLFLGREET